MKMLRDGADVNLQDDNFDTPLHVYVKKRRYECLLALLVHSNPESLEVDHEGGDLNSPLHTAAEVSHKNTVPYTHY